jgi:transcriptional regulator with XRE-family HTH domain
MSQAAVCRIETGRRRVTIDEIRYIAQVLGMPLGAVSWIPRNQAGEDVEPLSRRSLLGAGTGAVLGLSATTAPAAARQIDPRLVEHWSTLMSLLDDHDASFGSHGVLPAVRRELDLIAEHRQIAGGDLRTELLRVEARWSQFASYLEHDAGNERAADYWADRASQLAREADYPDMIARVFVRRSQWAVAQRDAPRAIAFAHAAHETPGTSGHIRALCAMKTADGHALANDPDACERSLADAHTYLDRADTAQPLDLASHEITPHYILAAEARCWLWLRPRKALTTYEDAINRWPRHRTRSRAVHQARLALACMAADEPERAASEGIEALEIARATKSKVILRDLTHLGHELAACDVPVAADFCEALATL